MTYKLPNSSKVCTAPTNLSDTLSISDLDDKFTIFESGKSLFNTSL